MSASVLVARRADAELIPSPDGQTVYDTIRHVTWLANANLAGTPAGQFGVAGIGPNGSMSYQTALLWVAALNGLNNGRGYLNHNTWTLPITPTTDRSCSVLSGPNGNSFGYGCRGSALGSLYYWSLRLHSPDTAVPVPDVAEYPFHDFQPYLYWSGTSSGDGNGFNTFSFNTGWTGSNVSGHYMYALPMIRHKLSGTYTPTGVGDLEISADGQTIYDPDIDVTWLADADLAKTQWFGAQCLNPDRTLCINPDGSMSHDTAVAWVGGMNADNGVGWLGRTDWILPPTKAEDASCIPGFFCTGSPMAELFYTQLGLTQGQSVIDIVDDYVGPFYNVQPYLYWACTAPDPCQGDLPAPGFGWSFSFGNGFQGTDVHRNNLYVMVYFTQAPGQALAEAINAALGTSSALISCLSQAAAIGSAPSSDAKAALLAAFIDQVTALRGSALNDAQADQLIALAHAV